MVAADRIDSMYVVHQRRTASGGAVRVEPRPGQVAGREELLAGLRSRLTASSGVATVALIGLGGVGKTTVAVEYSYRHIESYQVVWHFHAEEATGLLAQFHDLATVLDAGDAGDPVAAVHAALAVHPGPWLIVLDNVRDHAAARRWMPAKGNGHVLVTSQDGHWPAAQRVEVLTLSLEAATGFLLDRTSSPDVSSARAIAVELGLLPLALAQAAAFVETTGRSMAGYLELLRANRSEVLARGAPAAHATPVVATWALAFKDLEETSPGSITLLRLAAFLAPEDIPFRLLLSGRCALPEAVAVEINALRQGFLALDDAVAGLRRHSLIGAPSETFTVHRLVQVVTADGLEPAWRAAVAALVEAAVPQDVEKLAAWPVCRLLLPHAQIVADPLGRPMRRLARSLYESGDYATACTQWRKLADLFAAHRGPEHHNTLNALANLAFCTGMAGDAVGARDLNRELLPVRKRVAGPEHSTTLTTRANLAYWTGMAGDAVAARDLYRELLPVRERVSGPDDPATLTVRANVARWTGRAGDVVTARDLFRELLPVRERVSGLDHPDTLIVRENFASWTGRAGDAVTARDLLRELLPVRERVSGPEHPDTVRMRANLDYWTRKADE